MQVSSFFPFYEVKGGNTIKCKQANGRFLCFRFQIQQATNVRRARQVFQQPEPGSRATCSLANSTSETNMKQALNLLTLWMRGQIHSAERVVLGQTSTWSWFYHSGFQQNAVSPRASFLLCKKEKKKSLSWLTSYERLRLKLNAIMSKNFVNSKEL